MRNIQKNLEEGSHYEDNMELLENDIRSSTALIQENLQEYIYYEAVRLENIRRELEVRARNTLLLCTFSFVIILILVTILTRMITRSVTQPIRELCGATKKVAREIFPIRKSNPETRFRCSQTALMT